VNALCWCRSKARARILLLVLRDERRAQVFGAARIYKDSGPKHRGRAQRGLTVGRGITVRPQARPRSHCRAHFGRVKR
jgi:hypothetical protein